MVTKYIHTRICISASLTKLIKYYIDKAIYDTLKLKVSIILIQCYLSDLASKQRNICRGSKYLHTYTTSFKIISPLRD